jgi:hypothetical protein
MATPADTTDRASRLDALYAGVLLLGDWMNAHRRAVGLVGGPMLVVALVAINQIVLLDFPNSGDEYAYLYQAQTLAGGRLWNPAPADAELFQFNYIAHDGVRVYSTFPPGWPLMLAIGLRLGLPAWLVNPLMGLVTIALVWWLGTRLYHPRAGALAAVLVAISPFFLFNAASYFSHTFCGALLLGAACVASRSDRSPAWVPLLVGLLIGWAVLTRYFTGALCGVAIGLWLLRPGVNRARTLALFVVGGVPWALALLAYDAAITGDPWQLTTTTLTRSLWFRDGFVLRGADMLATQVLRYLLWTPAALVVAFLVYLRTAPESRRGLLTWIPVLMLAILYFYVERGGNQYGPRFHYEVFLFLVVFTAASLFRAPSLAVARRRDRILFGLLTASVAALPFSFAAHAVIEHEVIRERMDPYLEARENNLRDALVLVSGRVGNDRSMAATDLTRNGIDYRASILYGVDPGDAARCAAISRVPGRTAYLYVWDEGADDGELWPVSCPEPPPPASAGPPPGAD